MQKNIIIATIGIVSVALLILGIVLGTAQIKSNERVAKEIEQEEVKKFKIEDAKREYALCLDYSYQAYVENWDKHCEMLGKDADCGLPTATSKDLGALKTKANDDCMELYKLELSNI